MNIISGRGGAPVEPEDETGLFTEAVETWPVTGALAGSDLPWISLIGTPIVTNVLGTPTGWYNCNSQITAIVRDAGGYNGVIEFPYTAPPTPQGVLHAAHWPYVILRSDATRTVFTYIIFNQTTHLLDLVEYDGGATALTSGITTLGEGSWYGLRLTLQDGFITCEVDVGSGYVTDFTSALSLNLTAQYFGIGTVVDYGGAAFGAVHFRTPNHG